MLLFKVKEEKNMSIASTEESIDRVMTQGENCVASVCGVGIAGGLGALVGTIYSIAQAAFGGGEGLLAPVLFGMVSYGSMTFANVVVRGCDLNSEVSKVALIACNAFGTLMGAGITAAVGAPMSILGIVVMQVPLVIRELCC
ncbi:MAG: hypothetical protein SP1CHLAM54_07840 [Chlamydiia bacterium]|nr:hypothetical protein [Chlamydiia bacterium]MCH9615690.1 hypothetical protein [Chlamydiia bacterium]MCH9628907.1 hypothetical protein [Chlamydiia bacterium]